MLRYPACLLVLCTLGFGQGIATRNVKAQPRGKPSGIPFAAQFTDVAKSAGLTATSIYGDNRRVTWLLETSGGGVAFLDYDGDGWLDAFVSGGTLLENPPDSTNHLYRNNHDGSFTDVTEASGLSRSGWASGITVADYDNDGDEDIFLTYYGENSLYRNSGKGTFTDVTKSSGLALPAGSKPRWGAGATFLDFNRDGKLDLFVSNYVDFDPVRTPRPGANPNCNWKGVPVACGPRGLKPGRHWLYEGRGDGTFVDVSVRSGIARPRSSFGMTAVTLDVDEDGWPDIYVACDSSPSLLFRNNHDGTFSEEGLERGIALNDDGMEQAGMGVGVGDVNLDGRLDLFKTHFADDTNVLYFGDARGQFTDATLRSGLATETRFVSWGAAIADLDNDGLPDLLMVTGNVYPETEAALPSYPYKTPRIVFRNLGGGRFEELIEEAGSGIAAAHSSRGSALGDFDNDGDLDVLVFNRNEPPSLLRNDLKADRHWLQVRLVGTKSNRSAIGARVVAHYGERQQAQTVLSQSSFYSSNASQLHFGLGSSAAASITVFWPGGLTEKFPGLTADRLVTLREGEGKK
ncbi:MAG: CRTAC1 family protein [Bryobacteraceae bacterium]|nr:CRTAC1 family protein [Bryobacteraceae bacterium]